MTDILMTIGVILATLFVVASISVISILFWHSHTKNRYDLALFLIDDGNETRTKKAKLIGRTNAASAYLADDKTGKAVYVPHDYRVNYVKHRRRIDITSAYDLIYPEKNTCLEASKYLEIIKELTLDHIGSDIVRAIKGKGMGIGMVIIIAVIALIVGVVSVTVYNNFRKPKTSQIPVSANVTTQQQPTITPIIIQEVK